MERKSALNGNIGIFKFIKYIINTFISHSKNNCKASILTGCDEWVFALHKRHNLICPSNYAICFRCFPRITDCDRSKCPES